MIRQGNRAQANFRKSETLPRRMRYKLPIMLPKTEEKTANLPILCLLCVMVLIALTVPALYFGVMRSLPPSGTWA